MALWLSSQMVVVSVMGPLKISPIFGGGGVPPWWRQPQSSTRLRKWIGPRKFFFGLVADGPASDGEEIARTRLAGAVVVCLVSVGKACKLETVARHPLQRKAYASGAMEVPEYLLQGLHVSVRGGCLGGTKHAQRRGDIGARANCCVLETCHEARVDVLRHPGKWGGCHVRKAGEEAGVHREERWLRGRHPVLGQDDTEVFGLIQRDGA
jgi:hypothetical protein